MARPNKTGLDYFPFDVDFFEDEKIEAISGEFGLKGEIATVKLLCAVYDNGYFAVWNNLLKMKLLKRLPGFSIELLEQIVNRLVLWGFFEKSLFDSAGVLTSKGIQKRYFEATKRRNTADNLVYVLNNEVNVYINHPPKVVSVNINPQIKEKEIKGKEIKEEEEVSPPPDFLKNNREAFKEDLKENPPGFRAPPLTLDDYEQEMRNSRQFIETACMTRKATEEEVNEALRDFFLEKKAMNHKPKNGQDVMQHFLNWLTKWKESRDKKAKEQPGGKIKQNLVSSLKATQSIKNKGGYLTHDDLQI